jgi:hypothetical protein
VTAQLLLEAGNRKADGAESRHARKNIKTAAAAYLAASPRQRGEFWPFVSCTQAAFFMVKLLCGLVPRAHLQQEAVSNARFRELSQLRNFRACSLED